MAAIQGAGARAGATARWTIGYLGQQVHGYYYGTLLAGVLDAASQAESQVIAIQAGEAGLGVTSLEADPFVAPVAWDHIDAFVIVSHAVTDAYLEGLVKTGKPVVCISRELSGLPCPSVIPDNYGGIAAAVEHLVEHGHTRIGYAAREPGVSDDLDRLAAYRSEMRARGLAAYEPVTVPWVGEGSTADEAVRELLSLDSPPTAIVACTDVTAIAVIEALNKAGISVPRDMAIIGFDDIEDAAKHRPPLSTIAQRFTDVGHAAAELAFAALRGHPAEVAYHPVPVTLVNRETCGCSPIQPNSSGRSGDRANRAADRFVPDLVEVLRGEGELSMIRQADIAAVGEGILALFTEVAREPTADLSERVVAVAARVFELAPQERAVLRFMALLRRFCKAFITELHAGSTESHSAELQRALSLDDLAHNLSITVIGHSLSGRTPEYLHFQTQRKHYEITTDLLRRHNRDSRSLAWMARTEVRAGCFGIWAKRNQDGTEPADLRIVGAYDEGGGLQRIAERYPVKSFPPEPLLDLIGGRQGEVLYLLPVRFDGSDWGILAMIGPLEVRDDTALLEMFNHWAVMLTVALDQEQSLEEIRISEERYALAADAANDGLWDWDVVSGTAFFSTRWKALLGYRDEAMPGTVDGWLDRVHPEDRAALSEAVAQQLDGRSSSLEIENRMRASDGSYRWMLTRARSVSDEHGRVVRIVGSMTDVTDRKLLEEQLRHDALYDALTGLPNRTLFFDRLNQAMERTRRRTDCWFAVVFLDLDGFKDINDNQGHQAGDQVLAAVAQRLVRQMRGNDTVSRFGGDEFVVLLTDVRSVSDLLATVDRIVATVSQPIELDGQLVVVTTAAGIAVSLTGYENPDDILRDADAAMYQSKSAGSQSAVLADPTVVERPGRDFRALA